MRTAFAAGTCAAVTVAILWWHKRKASSRVLLVFDLNGVLCTRFQGLGGTALQTVSRSHAESFLSFAFAHFDVAMMTAQHRPRLLSELEQLCTSEQLRQLVFAWDGSHNAIMKGVYSPTSPAIPSKSKSGKPWFLKRLSDISSATGRSAERILIVDDAAEKLFGNPHGSGLIVPQIDCGEKCGSTSAMMAIAKNMRDNRPLDNFLAPDGHFTRALAELAAAAAANARLNVHAWTATHPFLQTLCHDDATMMLDPASNALCSGVRTAEEAAADDGRIIADYPYKVSAVRRLLHSGIFFCELDGGVAFSQQLAFEMRVKDKDALSRLKASVASLLQKEPTGEEVVKCFERALREYRAMDHAQQAMRSLGTHFCDLVDATLME